MNRIRVILYHKQATSARTRFLRLDYGGACGFAPLPPGARLAGAEEAAEDSTAVAAAVSAAEGFLGLDSGGLELQPGLRMRLEAPEGDLWVVLARFRDTDPPFALAEAKGARFVALTEMRGLPSLELELLRQAYEWIMGG
jgi:hypothetical protein